MKKVKKQLNSLYAAATVLGGSLVTGCCCPPPPPRHCQVYHQPVYVEQVKVCPTVTRTEYYIFEEEATVIEKYKKKKLPTWSRFDRID